jgi:Fe-S cluster assembly scaffold protein SufB
MTDDAKSLEQIGDYKYGFHDRDDNYVFKSERGLNRQVVENISRMKGEPQWMLEFRLKALEHYLARPMPAWGPDISNLDLDNIFYYVKPTEKSEKSWDNVPDDIKNTFDKLGIPEAEQKFLAGVGAQYECLSGDTRVYTKRGVVPIRDIVPGDVVFSLDEETNQIIPAPVKNFMPKGKRPVFDVKIGTRNIKATENHPFLVLELHRNEGNQRGRYARAWKYLRDLKTGDLVAVAKSLPDVGQDYELEQPVVETNWRHNHVDLPKHTSVDLMWWLGLYMGDGFIHSENEKARVEVAIPATDQPLRSEFKQVTSRLFDIAAQNGDPYRLTVGSTIVARYLETNGFSGGALKKRVPVWVASLPQEQILAFIGGYVDADGYVRDHAKNKDVMLTSANPDLLQDIRNLAVVCGVGTSNIHRFEGKHPDDKNRTMVGYRMMFSGDFERLGCRSEQRLARMDKRKFHHDYSMAEGTSFRNHVNDFFGYARVESITPAGEEMVYDIEVDGPHNFVAEGLIVHNSEMVYHSILEHLEKQGVIFLSIEDGLKQHPDLFREYFGTVIPIEDNKFAALNSAVWSGGSFVYVPKNVKVDLPLQAYFRLNTANVGQFERTLIIVDDGASVHYVEGCFLEGARVRTPNGEKPIEQISIGDEVLTHQGRWRKVYRTMKRPYHGNIYNIRFYGDSGRELRVTAEHPLLVVKRERQSMRYKEFQPTWERADSIKEGDYLVIPVPQPVMEPALAHSVTVPLGRGRHASIEREGNLPYEPDFFRLLGYYYSEGHVDNEHYLSISFHAAETEYLDDAKKLIEKYFGKSPIAHAPRQNGQTLVLSSTENARAFAREFGSSVYEKHIPEWVSSADPELLTQLIKGMWRGDGSYDAKKNMFRYNTVSANLAYGFRDACLRLGVAASVNLQYRESPRKDIYAVVIASPFNPKFSEIVGVVAPAGDLSGSPFSLDENFLYVPIKEISIEEQEIEVYNFSVEEDESYVAEGVVSHNCTAPQYTTNSFHSGVIEIIVKQGARSRYSTIQNWSTNVFNLVTQRAKVFANASHEWVDANLGSKLTMKYPSCYLMEPGARGEMLSMAFAGPGQTQDAGSKMIHFAPNTTSKITSKSISKGGGRASYRGLVKVYKGAKGVKSNVVCDALLLDPKSRSDTYPTIEIDEDDVSIGHEASVSKVGEEQLFYLMSRGLTESEATSMVVSGFIEPLVKELPMEYAVEMNRLIQLQMEGSIG